MIEVVFGRSAGGSLKVAQHFGKGKYPGSAVSVFLAHPDGRQPSEVELEAAKREYIRKDREAWEKAVPLGGNSGDVFCFDLALSVGDISEAEIGEKRQQVLEKLYSDFPEGKDYVRDLMEEENLDKIAARMAGGESVRIWYSDQPDEYCGLYWFLFQLQHRKIECDSITLVKLPDREYRDGNTMIKKCSWGDVSAEEWHRYLPLQEEEPAVFIRWCASCWKGLQEENMPLRAVISGRLMGFPEDIYDHIILREIQQEKGDFKEAKVIGRILGKYQLGISDAWIHYRIGKMTGEGKLDQLYSS